MVKVIKSIRLIFICAVSFLLALLIFGFFAIPDEISTLDSNKTSVNVIYSLDPLNQKTQVEKSGGESIVDVRVNLFKAIPVKTSRIKVEKRRYVVPSGKIFGLRIYTAGVVVVSTDKVDSQNGACFPAQDAGIMKGDIIISMNSLEIKDHTQVARLIANCGGAAIKVVFVRGGQTFETYFTPAYSSSREGYVGGLWIRDSAAGIGTMTFYEKSSGAYGGLGHAVCDVDTGEILPLSEGDVVEAEIGSCRKGRSGEAGELCGSFSGNAFGELYANTSSGVFGILGSVDGDETEIPVAIKSEIKTGKAKIIATVDKEGPKYYDVEIERIYSDNTDNRNMAIKITDKELLEKTGGIVQGMSGSPIIQNNKLVGAVTHVFINEPSRGYGIFAENMLEKCDEILNSKIAAAS